MGRAPLGDQVTGRLGPQSAFQGLWPWCKGSQVLWGALVVIELEAHAVVDLIVGQRDVVLVDGVPLLRRGGEHMQKDVAEAQSQF